jgi:ribosomal protein S21
MNKTVVIEDTRQGNESGTNLLRRFSRRVKDSNIIRNVRNRRYAKRKSSDLVTKRSALRRIAKMQEIVKLRKLGKIK